MVEDEPDVAELIRYNLTREGKFLSRKIPAPAIETVRGVGYRFREPGGA